MEGKKAQNSFYAKRIPLLAEEGNAPQRKCREATAAAQTGWSDRHPLNFAKLTTPALRATPPLRGGEYSVAAFVPPYGKLNVSNVSETSPPPQPAAPPAK